MLDAFWQWACSAPAQLGGDDDETQEEEGALDVLYACTLSNLMLRYGQPAAIEAVSALQDECSALMAQLETRTIAEEMRGLLQGPLGLPLRTQVVAALEASSVPARAMLSLIHALNLPPAYFADQSLGSILSPVMPALIRSVAGGAAPEEICLRIVRKELVRCGLLNRSFWTTDRGVVSETYTYGPAVPFMLTDFFARGNRPDVASLIAGLFGQSRFAFAAALEDVAQSHSLGQRWPGVRGYAGGVPEVLVPIGGLLGFDAPDRRCARIAAVSPFYRESLLEHLAQQKAARLEALFGRVQTALDAHCTAYWPVQVTPLDLGPGRRAWRVEEPSQPPFVLFASLWLTRSDLDELWPQGRRLQPDLLCVVTEQSLADVTAALRDAGNPAAFSLLVRTERGVSLRTLGGSAQPAVASLAKEIARQCSKGDVA